MTYQNNNVFADQLDDNQAKISKNRLRFGPLEMFRTSQIPSSSEGRLGDIVFVDDAAGPSSTPISERIPTSVQMHQKGASGWNEILNSETGVLVSEYDRSNTNRKVITEKSDFPTPVNGVITLEDNTQYMISSSIDLGSDRIQTGINNSIVGLLNESSIVASNLTVGQHLITTNSSLNIQEITLSAGPDGSIFDVDGCPSLIITNVLFTNSASMGNINDCGTFVMFISGWDMDGLVFSGTMQTVVFDTVRVAASEAGRTGIRFMSGSSVSSRVRISLNSFNVVSGAIGIDVDPSITINNETFVVLGNIFEGAGTYVNGISPTSDMSFFKNNVNLTSSQSYAQMTLSSNATITDIITQNIFTKISGTTTSPLLSRFTMPSNNRLVYTGTKERLFRIDVSLNTTGGTNDVIGVTYGVNGTSYTGYVTSAYLDANGASYATYSSNLLTLTSGDYVEIFIRNQTSTTDVTVVSMNVIIVEI